MNKALELSRGSIVGWLNSDDAYADRRAVAWAVDAFERRPEVDVVFGHALLVNEDDLVLQTRRLVDEMIPVFEAKPAIRIAAGT